MSIYFNNKDTLFDITEKYPETIPVFVSNGFSQMDDPSKRNDFGKKINLEMAMMLRQQDLKQFSYLLNQAIEQNRNSEDLTLVNTVKSESVARSVNVVGLLPCPVRIPLLETFNAFAQNYKSEKGIQINHKLKAASMGLDWVSNNLDGITDVDQLPDLFISAGFDMFFDENRIGQFKNNGIFKDTMPVTEFNIAFQDIDLKDPAGHYSVLSVVPAVFLINKDELDQLPIPRTWEDILKPEFEKRVSLPVGDFDLFNSIMLHIYKYYGDEGVARLGRSLLESLHPSQMVKSERKKENRPIVTIMPYFFTKMVKKGSSMEAIWPEDGALISPIFMLTKAGKNKELQPLIDFLSSREVGDILAQQGLFPSVHPDVNNPLPDNAPWMWLGWDFIYNNDIHGLIEHCSNIFEENLSGNQNLEQVDV